MSLAELTDEQLAEQYQQHEGNIEGMARVLDVAPSTLRDRLTRAGLRQSTNGRSNGRRRALPSISLEAIHEGMKPPNGCKVKAFLDLLDEESRSNLETALNYKKQDLSAPTLRQILLNQGFHDDDVPGVDAINAHRSGIRPCRCKG